MLMKKNMVNEEARKEKVAQQQHLQDQAQREEERVELQETRNSKNLTAAMVKSALGKNDDTLQKAVEVLHNQNGNIQSSFDLNYINTK